MNNKKKIAGFSLLSMMIFLVVVGVTGIYGFQIGIGFLDQQTLRGAAKAALLDAKSNEGNSAKEIKSAILRKISVNTINIPDEDVVVTKNSDGYEVEIDYIKNIKLTDRIKIVMDLNIIETTPK